MQAGRRKRPFTLIAIVVMCVVFSANGIISRDGELSGLSLWGGGRIVDSLGLSRETVFEKFQLYRLLTYGYVHAAVWHLLANAFAVWSVGGYLERKIGTALLVLVYHAGLVIAGAAIFLLYPNSFNNGASPAVFSCFGLLIHWQMRNKTLLREYRAQKGFVYCALFLILSNLLGWASFAIHLMGAVAGFLLGFLVRESK